MNPGQNKLSKPMGAVMLVSMALSFYFMITYTGPFQWLADLQLGWWQSYEEKITFLVTFLLLMGLGALLIWPFVRRSSSAANASTKPSILQRLGRLGNIGGVTTLVGIMLAAMAYRDVRRLQGNVELMDLNVEQLEAGQAPPSHYVKLAGVPLIDAKMEFGESGRSNMDTYVPVISENHVPSHGVRAFFKYKKDAGLPSRAEPCIVQGEIGEGGLPGAVRSEYERIGALTGGQPYYLLEPGKNPAETRGRMQGMLRIGVGILAGGILMLVIALVRARLSGIESA